MPVSADTGLIRRIRAGTPLPAKDLRKNPFFRNSNALMYTLSHFWRNGRVHISAISEINFRNACWGTSPNPSKMPQGHFVKTLWKTGRLSQKFWMWKKSSSGDFLLMFFRIKVEQKHAEKFRFVKNLASCFQMCYSKCKGTTAHKVVDLPVWQKPTCIRSRLQGRLFYFRLLFLSI